MKFLNVNLLQNRENLLITVLTVFCCGLILFRMSTSETIHYRFLLWNLFLALVPLLITHFGLVTSKAKPSNFKLIIIVGFWLLFFPNAPYILTDLFHLKNTSSMPIWFDLVLIMSFAWTGLLAGFLSLKHIENALSERFKGFRTNFLIVIMLFLSGFGIYLGRFLRWNSWDILKQPGALAKDVADRFINPFEHPRTWGVTFFVGILLIMMYYSLNFFLNQQKTPLKLEHSKN